MAQFARPDADISDGTWITQAAGTDLFPQIDEASSDDADYIRTALPTGTEACIVGLSDVTDPSVSTGHIVRWRAQVLNRVDDTINLAIVLRQGASATIATARTGAITDGSWTAGSYTLSGAEADAITDYTDLRFSIVKGGTQDDVGINVQLSWIELEVPDVAGGTATPVLAAGQYRRYRG